MSKPVAVVVEDDALTADMFAMAVREAGFESVILYDGHQVADRMRALQSSLLVLDLLLPEYPGVEVIRDVRGDQALAQAKIIAISADANLVDFVRENVDIVLVKPVGFVQLSELAKRFLPKEA